MNGTYTNGTNIEGSGNNIRRACDGCKRSKRGCNRSDDPAADRCYRCIKLNLECTLTAGVQPPESTRVSKPVRQTTSRASTKPSAYDVGANNDMPLLLPTLSNYATMDPGPMPAVQPFESSYPIDQPQQDDPNKLGTLQREVLLDLDLVKHCKSADKCAETTLPPELLGYDPSSLLGRMLSHSKTLLEIVDVFEAIPLGQSLMPDGRGLPTPPGSTAERCDMPTMFSLFSCYVCLIRIYRTILFSINDSMPMLLNLNQPIPQLFPGMNLGGFSLEARLDLQVQFLVQVCVDFLSKLEARFGIGENAVTGKSRFKPSNSKMLAALVEAEAAEQPPLHDPRGHCPPLKQILASLERIVHAETAKRPR